MQHLLDIYQQQREWARAAGVAEKLDMAGDQPSATVLAHFYCEQAEQAREKAGLAASRQLLDRALQTDENCVRASALRGDIAFQSGDYREAIEAYKQAIRIKPIYPEAHYHLGMSYLNTRDSYSALMEYMILKEIDNDLADKLFNSIYK